MSKGTKIALGIVAGLVLLCICIGIGGFIGLYYVGDQVTQSVVDNPEDVAVIADGIADYDLPPGYSEAFGMSLFGFDMVALTGADDRQMIMLMQFPQALGLDQAAMEQQMQESMQQQTGRQNLDLEVVDEVTTTIRDETVTLTIREGTDESGEGLRQLTGIFPGKDGTVLLMVMGPLQNWDQAGVDAFIASIR